MNDEKRRIIIKCFNRKVINIALFIVICILFLVTFLTEIYQYQRAEQRKEEFGFHNGVAYNISAETSYSISQHQAVSSSGEMLVYGYMSSQNGIYLGTLGSVDNSFMELEKLTFLEGNFPQNKNEIAVESIVLDQLNLPYRLGMDISLQITGPNNKTVSQTYTICGILETYSINWLNPGVSLISGFIIPEDRTILERHLFFIGDYENYEQMSELEPIVSASMGSYLEYNSYSYPGSEFSARRLIEEGIIVILSAIVCSFFVICLFISTYKTQSNRIRILLLLGADNGELSFYLFRSALYSWIVIYIVAVTICSVICITIQFMTSMSDLFVQSIYPYAVSGIVSLVLSFTGSTIQISLIKNVTMLPMGRDLTRLETGRNINHQHSNVGTIKSFIRLQQRRLIKFHALEVGISLISFVSIFVCLYGICDSYRSFYGTKEVVGYDYSWKSGNVQDGLSSREIQVIRNSTGIEEVVYASRVTSYKEKQIKLSFSDCATDPYTNMHNSVYDISDSSALICELVAIPENSLLWEYYILPNVNDLDGFRNGEIVIPFLPALQKSDADRYIPVNTFTINKAVENVPVYYPSLNIGEQVDIEVADKTYSFMCGNIISHFPSHAQTSMDFLAAGSILVSEKCLLEMIPADEVCYNYVFATGDSSLTYDISDKAMSNIAYGKNIVFENNRIEIDTVRKVHITDTISLGIIAITVFCFSIIILYRNRIHLYYTEGERISLLKKLGCDNSVIHAIFTFGSPHTIWGLFLCINTFSFLILSHHQYALFSSGEGMDKWRMIISLASNNFPWSILIIPQIIYLVILFMIRNLLPHLEA